MPTSKALKQAASGVLAARADRNVLQSGRLASTLAAVLLDDLFECLA